MTNIAKAIKQAAVRGEQFYLKACLVDIVNEVERSIDCTPIDGTAQLLSVNLEASLGSEKGLCVFPPAGSFVVVGYLDKNNAVVLLTDKIEKITLDVDTEIVINGGENHGLVKIQELTNKLNGLTDTVNGLINAYNTHIHITTATIAETPKVGVISPTTSQAQTAQAFDIADYENDKIKH